MHASVENISNENGQLRINASKGKKGTKSKKSGH